MDFLGNGTLTTSNPGLIWLRYLDFGLGTLRYPPRRAILDPPGKGTLTLAQGLPGTLTMSNPGLPWLRYPGEGKA